MKKNRLRITASYRLGILFVLAFVVFAALGGIFWSRPKAQNQPSDENKTGKQTMFTVNPSDDIKQIPKLIKNYKTAGVGFESRQLFKRETKKAADDAQLRDALSKGVVLNLDKQAMQRILNENPEYLNLPLPDGNGGTIELELVKVNILAPGFSVKTSAPTSESLNDDLGVHYRGIVKGNDRSLAAISIFKSEVMGFFSTEAEGNSVLGRLRGKNPTDRHILYADKNLKARPDFHCDTEDTNEILPEASLQTPEEIMARCVRIYLEANFDLFQASGSVTNATTYLTGVFNQSSVLYANEGIAIAISEIFVWNSPSPYTGTNSLQQLEQFQATRTTFNGNLAHLISLQSSYGGIAYRPGLCNTGFSYAFSGIDPTFQNVPTYSWTVMVFTHETGHNFGSPHTHSCAWNGNGTAIDGCAPTEPNSSCPRPGIPSGGGTMMSYCHLQSVGINFTLGFGPQPHNLILNNFNTLGCVSDCASGCTYAVAPPTSPTFTASGGSGSFTLTTGTSCSWSTIINAPRPFEFISSVEKADLFPLSNNSTQKTESQELAEISYRPEDKTAESTDAVSSPAANFPGTGVGAIPDGLTGTPPQYGAPLNISFAVSGITAPVTSVSANVTLNHTWSGDVDMVLKAPGGSPSQTLVSRIGVTTAGSFGSANDYSGTYSFTDSAAGTNIWTAATANPIPPGNYRTTAPGQAGQTNPAPVTNLTASFTGLTTAQINGTWTLTVRDGASSDIGSVTAASLDISGGGSAGWINVTSAPSGSGNSTINYNVSSNPSTSPRSGTITVGGQVHTVNQSGTSSPGLRKPFDFDGDSKTDISIYRPSNGQWWINRSSNGTTFAAQFGNSADRIAPADYTGDGKTDIAFWRPSTGEWFILRSENGTYYSGAFGTNGDIPAPGDFDLDGKADLVVFRPSTGVWYIFNSSNLSVSTIIFGQNGDIPVTADYDGDNRADAVVFRPSTGVWWLRRSTLGVIAFQFGNSADKPAPGDYTGDAKADVAFWRPSTREWFILRSENQSYYSGQFGAIGDIPVPGDYDGDGRHDPAVFRPSTNTWYVQRSTNINNPLIQTFGSGGDKPVPSAFVP